MIARVFTGLVWAAVLATAGYWGWRLWAPPATATGAVPAGEAVPFAQADLGRLLGALPATAAAAPVEPDVATRFRLSGVVASRAPAAGTAASAPASPGVAVLAFDGRLARAYQVGDKVGAGWVLQAVSARSVTLAHADGAGSFTLAVPPRSGEGALPGSAAPGAQPPAPAPVTSLLRPRPAVPPPPPQAEPVPGQEFVDTPDQGQNVDQSAVPAEPVEPDEQVR